MRPDWRGQGLEATLANLEIPPDLGVGPRPSLDHRLKTLPCAGGQRLHQLYSRLPQPVLNCAVEEERSQGLDRTRRAVAAWRGSTSLPGHLVLGD